MSKKDYKQGQIDLFNRLWDASLGKSKNPLEVVSGLVDEMILIKDELGIKEGEVGSN